MKTLMTFLSTFSFYDDNLILTQVFLAGNYTHFVKGHIGLFKGLSLMRKGCERHLQCYFYFQVGYDLTESTENYIQAGDKTEHSKKFKFITSYRVGNLKVKRLKIDSFSLTAHYMTKYFFPMF